MKRRGKYKRPTPQEEPASWAVRPPGAPPAWDHAAELAAAGSWHAASWCERHAEALHGRARLVAALSTMVPAGTRHDLDTGRVAVTELDSGRGRWRFESARLLRDDWIADPRKTAAAMEKCGQAWGIHRGLDGSMGVHPWGCGSPLCPVCSGAKAACKADLWTTCLSFLLEMGFEVRHLTLTQRIRNVDETLGDCLARLGAAWKVLVDGRGSRARWADSVAGYILGTEWTGRHPETGVRRWHAHLHVLLVCWPGKGDSIGEWVGERWAAITGDASPTAQHVSSVELVDALREVLKYPFKPLSMDDRQIAETLVTTKGLRPNRVGGGLHGASRVGRLTAALLAGDDEQAADLAAELGDLQRSMATAIAAGRLAWDEARPRPVWIDTSDDYDADDDAPVRQRSAMGANESRGSIVDAAGRLWRLLTLAHIDRMDRAGVWTMHLATDPVDPSTWFEQRPWELAERLRSWADPGAP